MLVKQLSIFLQNRPGHLIQITEILKNNDLDIRAINVSEGNEFGILRLIVDDVYKAQFLLKDQGYLCRLDDVLAVEPEDKVGILYDIFSALGEAGININYIYSNIRPVHGEFPTIILSTTDLKKSQEVIQNIGISLVPNKEVASSEHTA